tara:strand:+ start:53 stop:634 length:582 start_codon:yes stop_codon:yes gene_type:complete
MNIFYVDKDPAKAAKMMCDKHIIKMILESAQMLCSAKRMLDGTEYYDKTKNGRKIKRWRLDNPNEEAIIYKAGWAKHPSTQWVMKSAYNYRWLYLHMLALNEEYKLRWQKDKNHVAIDKLADLLKHPPKNAPLNVKGSDATPAMPEHCKVPGDSVASYRKYYILEKRRFAKWEKPNAIMPDWYKKGIQECQSS